MMRSGQYKMSGVGSRTSGAEVTINQFKPMKHEFEEATPASKSSKARVHVSSSDGSDLKSPSKKYQIYSEKTHGLILEAVEPRSSPSRKVSSQRKSLSKALNKSCENLISPMNAVNRVEQKVKNLLHRGDTKNKQDDKDHSEKADDSWQYGHLITLPRRNRRSLALSNSTVSSFSDTASYVSGSSGYSSSSSSSCYGSFKSSSSASSTLQSRKSITESISDRSISQCSNETRETLVQPHSTLVDNPMYDITPAMARLYGTPSTVAHCDYPGSTSSISSKQNVDHVNPIYDIPQDVKNQMENTDKTDVLSCLEESGLGMECSDSDDQDDMEDIKITQEDPVARECRQYFEQRLKNSKQLKKRWSLSSEDSGADSGDNESILTLKVKSPEASEMPVQYKISESNDVDASVDNFGSQPHGSTSESSSDSCSKSPFDLKMDFLRKEIAGLMKQDNALFRQLLTLHDSIGALRTQQQPPPPQPGTQNHHQTLLHLNWADLTEEEEDDHEELLEELHQETTDQRTDELHTYNSEAVGEHLEELEDEGLEVDRSISISPSPNSSSTEDSSSMDFGSISLSPSPNSTLSSIRDNSSLSSSPVEDNNSLSISDTPNSTISPPSPNLSLSSSDDGCLRSVTYSPISLLSHAEDNFLLSLSHPMSTASIGNSGTVNPSDEPELSVSPKEDNLTTDNLLFITKTASLAVLDGNKETQENNKFPSCSKKFLRDTSKTRYPNFLLDSESSNVQPEKVNTDQYVKSQSSKFDNLKSKKREEKENNEHTNEVNGFIRCQKSYAPNARNRRRSSSVNHNPCKDSNQRNSISSTADLDKRPSRIPCLTQSSKTQIRERTSSSPFPLNGSSSTKFTNKLKVVNNSSTKLQEKKSLRCATEAASTSPSRRETKSNLRPLPRPPYRESLIM
ncbi:unnamed protein product [Meganyctiphanes norvegica]|uniref:Serine-rich adhesin for platelets-like n=1 Tax=Meganyctiphanes norvegica TaxID=48144 RepID=A0AAV2PTC6_MEGNR